MLLAQFTDFMVLLLIAAAVVSGFVGELRTRVVILGIVVLNAAVGFVQEYRAERAMAALQRHGRALRRRACARGGRGRIAPTALVPGDVVLLEAGQRRPGGSAPPRSLDLRAR